MPEGQQPRRRGGRRDGPLAGVSAEGDALAAWLRQVTAGRTLDQLVAEFNTYQRATWGEFRSGRRPIPLPLLRKVVTRLVTEPGRQARELERGRALSQAAASAAAVHNQPAGSASAAGLSVRELQIRLDDARRGHIEVQQALLDNQNTIRVLEATITSLEERCAQLETERDQALGQARSVTEVQQDLEAFSKTLARAEERLELAFTDRGVAEVLLADVRRHAENYRRGLASLQHGAPADTDQNVGEASGDEPRATQELLQPQQWQYELLLETVDDRREARHEQLAQVRQRMGLPVPDGGDDALVNVAEGLAGIVQEPGTDNPDNAPTSRSTTPETETGAVADGRGQASPASAAGAERPSPGLAPWARRLGKRRAEPRLGGPDGSSGFAPGRPDTEEAERAAPGRPPRGVQLATRTLRDGRLRAVAAAVLMGLTVTTSAPSTRTPSSGAHTLKDTEPAPPLRWTTALPYSTVLGAATTDTLFFQDTKTIWAVDTATGTTRWTGPSANAGLYEPMAADKHTVYAATDSTTVQAFKTATGAVEWNKDMSDLTGGTDLSFLQSIVLSDSTPDVVYVSAYGWQTPTAITPSRTHSGTTKHAPQAAASVTPAMCLTRGCGNPAPQSFLSLSVVQVTAAFSTRTGAELWHTDGQFLSEAGTVCLTTSDEGTQGVDCRTGVPRWETDTDCTAVVTTGTATTAVCTAGGHLHGLDPATGHQQWKTATPFPEPLSTLQVLNGLAYFTAHNGRLYAVDTATGTTRWSAPAGKSEKTPVPDRDRVYAVGSDGRLYGFNATTGTRLWSAPVGGNITAGPQTVGNTVYVGGKDGRLYVLDRSNGTRRWSTSAGGAAITHLHATPEHVTTLTGHNYDQNNHIVQQR